MKRGKEVSLELDPKYKVVVGTVDNNNPKSVYISITSWGELLDETYENYEKTINKKIKKVKKTLNTSLTNHTNFYRDKTIVDFNMASSGVKKDKRSFMSVELTLFQKGELHKVNSNAIKKPLIDISKDILEKVFNVDEDFTFHKKKN